MRFTKMHGLGNDYIFINCMAGTPDGLPELARRLSDRHFGVGGDGIICVCQPTARPSGRTLKCGCSTPTAPRGPCAATASAALASTCTTRG